MVSAYDQFDCTHSVYTHSPSNTVKHLYSNTNTKGTEMKAHLQDKNILGTALIKMAWVPETWYKLCCAKLITFPHLCRAKTSPVPRQPLVLL